MSKELDGVAKSLFEKIRARFEGVSVGDEEAKVATDPGKARFFNFDYVDAMGNNFGNVTISLIDEQSLKIYFGKNLSADLDDSQKKEWYDFLRDIRMFAKRNLLSFDTRDISRSNLNIKDLQQLSAAEKPATSNDVTESRLYGTAKTSYDTIAPGVRLVIRHSGNIDDTIHGARSRKIHKIYIEDPEGQRLKSPFTHVGGARALARHVAHGGQVNDEFAGHITGLVDELSKLKNFIRGSRNKTFEDGEAGEIVSAAKERYRNIHGILGRIKGVRGYQYYKEQWNPSDTLQDDFDADAVRSKFTVKKFDERMEDGLPYAHKAYRSMQQEFVESMDQIAEGTWAVPDNDIAIKHLQELMSDVLPAGIDGTDATGALYDILGDDDLYDRIYDASRGSPEMDVRPIVYDWLKSNMPGVFQKVQASMENGGVGEEEPAPPQQEEPAPAPEPQEPAQEEPNAAQQQPQKSAPGTESIARKGTALNEYYSVESDSPPFYIHSTRYIDSAKKYLQKAQERGQSDAKIYEISIVDGKKVKKPLTEIRTNTNATKTIIKESTQLDDICRLAGLK